MQRGARSVAVQLWTSKLIKLEQKRLDKKPKVEGRLCAENFSNAKRQEADFVNDLYLILV
jgi:hypothetical protein